MTFVCAKSLNCVWLFKHYRYCIHKMKNKKYHSLGTIPILNIKILERGKIDIFKHTNTWSCTFLAYYWYFNKSGRIKIDQSAQTSSLSPWNLKHYNKPDKTSCTSKDNLKAYIIDKFNSCWLHVANQYFSSFPPHHLFYLF
jgi:hypothetical protein